MPESDVQIRPERADDADAVDHVEASAFPTRAEADLARTLRNAKPTPLISLVAEVDARVVGHVLFTPVIVESEAPWTAMGLGPVAVEPAFQRRGIGSRLVRAGLDACRAAHKYVVFVVGHPEYYPRFGFAPASRRGLRWDRPVPDEVFMVTELRPGAIPAGGGVVKYRPEFGSV